MASANPKLHPLLAISHGDQNKFVKERCSVAQNSADAGLYRRAIDVVDELEVFTDRRILKSFHLAKARTIKAECMAALGDIEDAKAYLLHVESTHGRSFRTRQCYAAIAEIEGDIPGAIAATEESLAGLPTGDALRQREGLLKWATLKSARGDMAQARQILRTYPSDRLNAEYFRVLRSTI